MTARTTCERCGKRLPIGRKRFCCAQCTLEATKAMATAARYECRICGAKMYVKPSDGMCPVCRELLEKRKSSKDAERALELVLTMKAKHKDADLKAWRDTSRCFRCEYGRPLYDNVVFCNSTEGTCIKREQIERIRNARKEEGKRNGK